MPKFRKRPLVIDAHQWDGDLTALVDWSRPFPEPRVRWHIEAGAVLMPTDRGVMRAEQGDWIIRGVAGELYPCEATIFAQSYETVEESAF
jgi:hypothetical protein